MYRYKPMATNLNNVEDRVFKLVRAQLALTDDQEITLESTLDDDLNADSLDRIELLMFIEDEFDINMKDEVAHQFKTVGDAVNYLKENFAGKEW